MKRAKRGQSILEYVIVLAAIVAGIAAGYSVISGASEGAVGKAAAALTAGAGKIN